MNSKNFNSIKGSLKESEQIAKRLLQRKDCLIVKPANHWIDEAKNRPIPDNLFGDFWFERELCILYADTNLGKSILAVQIANSISNGVPFLGLNYKLSPQKVFYLDCELSDKQFENRYSNNYKLHHRFSDNLYRAELNSDSELPKDIKTFEEFLFVTLENYAKNNNYKVFIIDNISYLNNDNEKAKFALDLIKRLNKLTKEYGCSVLALSHTPKRDDSKPISKNDLAGSKMLINFCDSAFAIGNSVENPNYRYLKQIKQRNTEQKYHAENIVLCELLKEDSFLQFQFLDFDSELQHINTDYQKQSENKNEVVKNLVLQGFSNVDIAKQLNCTEGAIRKRRKNLGI